MWFFFKVVLGLHCWAWGFPFIAVYGLLIEVVSLVMEHRLKGIWASVVQLLGSVVAIPGPQSIGLTVVGHRLSCSEACGIFPDQGWNPCLVHWQVDS